jgi:hypothetical protein
VIDSDTPWPDKEIPKPLEDMFVILVASQIIVTYKEVQKAEMLEEGIDRRMRGQFMLKG